MCRQRVYLTGSLLDPERLRPGYSDVDLAILADLPTLEDELLLSRNLRDDLRRLNAMGELFKHLDYVDRRDLDFLRLLGNSWSLALDSSWQRLAGTDRLEARFRVAPEKVHLERFIRVLCRWQEASSFLLDGGEGRDPMLNVIGARRTLADTLSVRLGQSRFTRFELLLESARTAGGISEILASLARDPARTAARRPSQRRGLPLRRAGSAGVVWRPSSVPIGKGPGHRRASPRSYRQNRSLAALAKDARFSAAYVAPDRYGDETPFVLAPQNMTARSAVENLRSLLRARAERSDRGSIARPILLTAPLWQAAALLDSPPLTGAALAVSGRKIWGETWSVPPRPEGQTWDDLIVGRAVEMLVASARSRASSQRGIVAVRSGKMRHEVLVKAPALRSLLGVSGSNSSEPSSFAEDERTLIENLRRWSAEVRPALAARVTKARRRAP